MGGCEVKSQRHRLHLEAMEKDEDQPRTEQTREGLTVPVPKREDFFTNLRKLADPDKPVVEDEDPSPPHGDPLA